MNSKSLITYLLVIKRKHKDFLPLEWNRLKSYQGENLLTLKGIDEFTAKKTSDELFNELLSENMIDKEDDFQSFVIIYFEKGRYRELKDEPIFNEKINLLNNEFIADSIISNSLNKSFINELNNLVTKTPSKELINFLYIIKNIDFSDKETTKKRLIYILKQIPYEEFRHLAFIIYKKSLLKH